MLIQCPECDLQVSDKANTCPHCGYPLKPDAKPKSSRKPNKRRRLPNGFGVSKSTVHKDCVERMNEINASLAAEVRKVLDINKSERHIRGGLATRKKYLQKKY